MQIKQTLLLAVGALFLGCGVMSNPDQANTDTAGDGADISGEFKSFLTHSLYTLSLDEAYPSYQIHSSQETQTTLMKELNATLPQSIDYQQYNLLAYPITMQEGCTVKESIMIDNNTTIISIKKDDTICIQTPTNYLLFYQIDKSTESIMIDKFDEENVTILNSKKL